MCGTLQTRALGVHREPSLAYFVPPGLRNLVEESHEKLLGAGVLEQTARSSNSGSASD